MVIIRDKKLFNEVLKQDYKRISININKKSLEKIDKIAKILGINRTPIFEGIITPNINSHLRFIIKKFNNISSKEYNDYSKNDMIKLNKIKKQLSSLAKSPLFKNK